MAFKDLFRPGRKHNNPLKRIKAVKKLKNQGILAEIAKNDEDLRVRRQAIWKLKDQRVLAEIAKNDKEIPLRQAAIEKLEDQGILAEIAKNDKEIPLRQAALEKLEALEEEAWEEEAWERNVKCARCGRGVMMSWTCPECNNLFCDICSGMTKPESRPQNMGGFTTQVLGGGTPRCPICEGSENLEVKGKKASFDKVVTQDPNRYEFYTASSRYDALDFLREYEVKEPRCYVIVKTPEGDLGKDLIGIYDNDTNETLEYGKRKPLPDVQKSDTLCARCGYYVLKATSLSKNASIEEMRKHGAGFYCYHCETIWCAFCVSHTESGSVCAICRRPIHVMDF